MERSANSHQSDAFADGDGPPSLLYYNASKGRPARGNEDHLRVKKGDRVSMGANGPPWRAACTVAGVEIKILRGGSGGDGATAGGATAGDATAGDASGGGGGSCGVQRRWKDAYAKTRFHQLLCSMGRTRAKVRAVRACRACCAPHTPPLVVALPFVVELAPQVDALSERCFPAPGGPAAVPPLCSIHLSRL